MIQVVKISNTGGAWDNKSMTYKMLDDIVKVLAFSNYVHLITFIDEKGVTNKTQVGEFR